MTSATASTPRAPEPDLRDALTLLRATRVSCVLAATFLAVQLFGNLYEEIVSNTAGIAHPRVGALVGELAPGSPLYYYLPWAPLGVVLVAVLAVRLPRLGAPAWVTRRVRGALAALALLLTWRARLLDAAAAHRPEREAGLALSG